MIVYRKSVLSAVLFLSCMMLPNLALADNGTDFSNSGGTLSGTNAGLSLTGSTLIGVTGLDGLGTVTGNLGTLTFSTGALTGGSLQAGGTFGAGGAFTITGNGTGGIPNGVIFSGTFDSATWTLDTLANGTHNYTLTGILTGTLGTTVVEGVSVQLTVNTGTGYFSGSTTLSSGNTWVGSSKSTIPEPSALVLFGTGAIGLAGSLRKKKLQS
jgi:hypothetical protein